MYIKKVEIKNIRSITNFTMDFPDGKEAGWHVLIGDNGVGKSTILQATAMGLIGVGEVARLNQVWDTWLKKGTDGALIKITYRAEEREELPEFMNKKNDLVSYIEIKKDDKQMPSRLGAEWKEGSQPSHKGKRFGCGFGAFRRFTGGEAILEEKAQITPITPFETLFRPEVILSSSLAWVKDIYLRSLEGNPSAIQILEGFKLLTSSGDLLPNQLSIEKINADGIFFKDLDGNMLHIGALSDGVKSTLALIFELIRLMLNVYDVQDIFGQFPQDRSIQVAGVVLIDEIDAHLHPTWQTRIGQWFTRFFPNIQFIVTTHSPLICRGCVNDAGQLNGSIWRLAVPGSGAAGGLLDGTDRDRLIYGNVLDAFGTGAFGDNVERTANAQKMLKELAQLDKLNTFGQITPEQDRRRLALQKIFTTDVITDF